jgi:hypothetical protein
MGGNLEHITVIPIVEKQHGVRPRSQTNACSKRDGLVAEGSTTARASASCSTTRGFITGWLQKHVARQSSSSLVGEPSTSISQISMSVSSYGRFGSAGINKLRELSSFRRKRRNQLFKRFASFSAESAECFKKEDRERLLAVIQEGFGGFTDFDKLVQEILITRIAADDLRDSSSMMSPPKQSQRAVALADLASVPAPATEPLVCSSALAPAAAPAPAPA